MLCTAGGITLKEGGQVQKLVDFLVSGRSGVPQKHLCFVLALAEALTIVNVHQPTPPPQPPLPYIGCCCGCGCCGAGTGAIASAETAITP